MLLHQLDNISGGYSMWYSKGEGFSFSARWRKLGCSLPDSEGNEIQKVFDIFNKFCNSAWTN